MQPYLPRPELVLQNLKATFSPQEMHGHLTFLLLLDAQRFYQFAALVLLDFKKLIRRGMSWLVQYICGLVSARFGDSAC